MSLLLKCVQLKTFLKCSAWTVFRSRIFFNSESSSSNSSVSQETIDLLERLSLVKFNNEAGIRRLESAIKFADQLQEVNTNNVEPLYSVQENRSLYLRPDIITETDHCEELLDCAKKTLDDCFVAPPGNIPLNQQDRTSADNSTTPGSSKKTSSSAG